MKFFLFTCFVLLPQLVWSQNPFLRFEHIKTSDGLSQSSVTGIIQDRQGFMWFATRDGLNKYDGYKFTVYKNEESNATSISNNNIRKVIEDSDGNLWIATWGGGLNFFDREKEVFDSFQHSADNENSISNNYINDVCEDHNGSIWIATDAGGLNIYDRKNNTFRHFRRDKSDSTSLSDDEVRVVLEDSQGRIWVGTKSGINLLDKKEEAFIKPAAKTADRQPLPWSAVRSIFEDRNYNLWVGTTDHGLLKYDPQNHVFVQILERVGELGGLNSSTIYAINEDDKENLWVGAENGGLLLFNPRKGIKQHYTYDEIDPYSIANNSVYSIYKDETGNVWVGFFGDGISFYNNGHKFNYYRKTSSPSSLSDNKITSVYEDSQHNIWVCTDGGGLNKFDDRSGTFTRFRHIPGNKNSICGDFALTIEEGLNGNLWMGTWGAGATMFNPSTNLFRHYQHVPDDPTSLSSNNVFKILRDADHNLWIATYGGGLNLLEHGKETFVHFRHEPDNENSLCYDNLHDIYLDSEGYLWIATDGGGVSRLHLKTRNFKTFRNKEDGNSISHNGINCFFEDNRGYLWIGTLSGLNRYDRKADQFKVYGLDDGLPNDVIWGILEDSLGNLWLSTNSGLSRFDPVEEVFTNYTATNGLQSNEFSRHAYLKSSKGLMYFGGKNGLNEFDPQEVDFVPYNPPLVLTDFLIFNYPVPIESNDGDKAILTKHISYTRNIELSYDQSVLTFHYASLNFINPDRRKYSYMLEGFDKDWRDAGNTNSVTYTNLDPGAYRFRVRGQNNLGEWSPDEIALLIRVSPPFWLTWWFKVLMAMLVLAGFFSFYFLRMNILKSQRNKLEEQVRERTAEVMEQNEEITSQREALELAHAEVLDSIRAASEIQRSLFPSGDSLKKYLPHSFVFNKPKNVVSGDFFWFKLIEKQLVLAVVDCTGHGVSGALMATLGHNLLNHCIYMQKELIAAAILDQLNAEIINELRHKGENSSFNDGMDMAICILDTETNVLQYAGAKNPLYILRKGKLTVIPANKFSVGHSVAGRKLQFTNHTISCHEDDVLFIFSDGYADQFGGPDNEKFMYPRFRRLLTDISSGDIHNASEFLEDALATWQGDTEQMDDIIVVGFKPRFPNG